MKYHIRKKEDYADGLRRVAHDMASLARTEAIDPGRDQEKVIHEVRKVCKRERAVLRLFRPHDEEMYQEENAWFRDAAGKLSSLRDATAMIECYDKMMSEAPTTLDRRKFSPIRRALNDHRDDKLPGPRKQQEVLNGFAGSMEKACERIAAWEFPRNDLSIVLDGFLKTYKRGRKAMRQAGNEPSVGNYHEWRKRVKYHRYQLRNLRKVWKPLMNAQHKQVKKLSSLLGDDHDIAVLAAFVRENLRGRLDADAMLAFDELAAAQSNALRAEAHILGARVYAEKPKHLGRKIVAWNNALAVSRAE